MVVARVDVGEDSVLVLQPAVVPDGWVMHRRERVAGTNTSTNVCIRDSVGIKGAVVGGGDSTGGGCCYR
jgi:carbonic anhydrase/acetyltransferase-like protein (isoleucine patch superfamily)